MLPLISTGPNIICDFLLKYFHFSNSLGSGQFHERGRLGKEFANTNRNQVTYSRVPLMWTLKRRAKSVHISEPSTVVDTLSCRYLDYIELHFRPLKSCALEFCPILNIPNLQPPPRTVK